jgi:hypothetical protein
LANEITHTGQLQVTKGSLAYSRSATYKATLTDANGLNSEGAKSIPTTAAGTALPMGDVTTAGMSFFRNLDANNYIELGVQVAGTFYPFAKLKPGEVFTGRLGTVAPYARANTAAAVLEFAIFQD